MSGDAVSSVSGCNSRRFSAGLLDASQGKATQKCSLRRRKCASDILETHSNILISAALFPGGRAALALRKALNPPYEPLVCDYVLDELRRKFREKFPDKAAELDAFLHVFLDNITLVSTPEDQDPLEAMIRDVKDRPILRAALNAHADLFLTGDMDFLESSVADPRIIGVAEFLHDTRQ